MRSESETFNRSCGINFRASQNQIARGTYSPLEGGVAMTERQTGSIAA